MILSHEAGVPKKVVDKQHDLERACDREAAPRIPAPANEATVTLSLAHESVATSRDAFDAAFRRDVAASLAGSA